MTTLGLYRVRPGQGVLELVNCSDHPGYPLGIRPCPEHGMLGFGFRSDRPWLRGLVEGLGPFRGWAQLSGELGLSGTPSGIRELRPPVGTSADDPSQTWH